MGEGMRDVGASEARRELPELLNRVAYGRERIRITRRGKPLAALISVEDLELLEALEDARDVADYQRALAEDDGRRVSLAELRAELDAVNPSSAA